MKITKELLERYELGQCTKPEVAAVSRWLDRTDLELDEDHPTVFPAADPAKDAAIKAALWQNIAADMTENPMLVASADSAKSRSRYVTWLSMAAATVLLLGIGWWCYPRVGDEAHFFNVSNSGIGVMRWEEDSFACTLSKNSSASINLQSGNMAVSGDVLFSPKKDIKLYDKHTNTALDFRQGEVYFICTDPDTSELVVFSKSELEYLPPILRKHIRKQFHLT